MAALGLASLPVSNRGFNPQQQQQQQGGGGVSMQQQLMAPMQQQLVAVSAPPQPTQLDAAAITIKLATLAGERFKDVFYTVFDAHRADLHRFFSPQHSLLVWEGTPGQGSQQCQKLFEMLPSSKHTVQTFDVQPVTGGQAMRGTVNTILVTVTGTVIWGLAGSEISAAPVGFCHTFILERSQPNAQGKQVHHIISASMRTKYLEEQQVDLAQPQSKKRRAYAGRN